MTAGERIRLADAVADVCGVLRLEAVLRRLLRHTARLTGPAAGSVSLIDAAAGHHTKAAELGALCRLGDTFPLDEGATRRAFGSRRPVVLPEYGQLRAGHLARGDPARHGPAAAVPIWWRGDVIAVSVTFAPRAGFFATTDVDELHILYRRAHQQLAARGITVGRSYVNEYCTSLDMAGASLTSVRLDDEISTLLAAPAEAAIRVF